MLENFIYAKEKSLFEEKLNNGEVLDEAIVFIEDTKEIWNHGTYFKCSAFDQNYTETDPVFSASAAAGIKSSDITNWNSKTSNVGTITGVSINDTSVATNGVANIPAASTSAYGVTKLSSSTNSTSTTLAATASAVRSVYVLADGKISGDGTITKIVKTTSLPSSPDANTLYIIP